MQFKCVDFFISFTKLKKCKFHVCFVFFIYSNYSIVSPPHPITLRTLHLNTDTHHSHSSNPASIQTPIILTATWHVCKSQLFIGPCVHAFHMLCVHCSLDSAHTPLWLLAVREAPSEKMFQIFSLHRKW